MAYALSDKAQSYLLRLAAGERLDWYPEQGHLGYRLDGRTVMHGTAIAELRQANLLSYTEEDSLPWRLALSEEGMALAQVLRSTPEQDRKDGPEAP